MLYDPFRQKPGFAEVCISVLEANSVGTVKKKSIQERGIAHRPTIVLYGQYKR